MIARGDKIEVQGRINRDLGYWRDDGHLQPSTTTDFTRRGDSNILAGFSIIPVLTYRAFWSQISEHT